MELRGLHRESASQTDDAISIETKSDSDESVLIRIVTKTNLKLNGIGIDQAKIIERIVEEEGIDKIVVFGNRFTKAATRNLGEQGIEFFHSDQQVVSFFNPRELYLKIRDNVDSLCEAKCGRVPQSEAECTGFSEGLTECTFCGGDGKLKESYREQKCPICGGAGSRKRHYSCITRLISDNSDFHFKHGWVPLLRNDLTSLLKIHRSIKRARDGDQSTELGYG